MIRGDGAIGPELTFWDQVERLIEVLQRPAVFITLILIAILMLLSFEYGSMQRQMNLMEDHMRKMHNREKDLLTQISRLRGDVRKVTQDERRLKSQESNLDKQFKKMQEEVKKIEENEKQHGWSDSDDKALTTHQSPLQTRAPTMGPFGRPLPPFLQGLGDLFKNAIEKIKNKKAEEPPHPHLPHFSLPPFSLFNDFHPMPEIEIIEIDGDEPTESAPPKRDLKIQKID